MAGYSGGESGFVGGSLTWKPGDVTDPAAFITPTQFYKLEASPLTEDITHIEHDTYAGPGRDIDQDHRSGKSKTGGSGLTGGSYPNNKYELRVGAIGTDQLVSAVSADTTVSINTAGNVSTFVLTTGDAGYAYGDQILVDTGAVQEARFVMTYDVGSKTGTCSAFKYPHTSAGTAIHKVLQHKARPYTESDGTGFSALLRRFCFEQADGTNYSYRYLNGQVMKMTLKGAAAKFEESYDVWFSADRVLANGQGGNPSMSTFSKDASWNDLGYEFNDGFYSIPDDPTDSGTATEQKSLDGQDWEVTVDNGAKEEPCFDEQRSVRWFPHARKVTVKFKRLTKASRPVGFNDFLSQDKNARVTFQMAYKAADGSIKSQAICLPNVRYTKSTAINGLNMMIGEEIEGEALAVGSTPKLFIQSINDFASAV